MLERPAPSKVRVTVGPSVPARRLFAFEAGAPGEVRYDGKGMRCLSGEGLKGVDHTVPTDNTCLSRRVERWSVTKTVTIMPPLQALITCGQRAAVTFSGPER